MVKTKRAHLRARLRRSGGSALVKINFNDENHKNVKYFLKDFGRRRAWHSF